MGNPIKPPGASRRALLRGSGGMLAAGTLLAVGNCTPTLAPAVAPNPDAELIALCDCYIDARAAADVAWETADLEERRRLSSTASSLVIWDDQPDPMRDMLREIAKLPATTRDGLQAKARITDLWLWEWCGLRHSRPGPLQGVATSLMADLLEGA